jgi:hypothetical protein
VRALPLVVEHEVMMHMMECEQMKLTKLISNC